MAKNKRKKKLQRKLERQHREVVAQLAELAFGPQWPAVAQIIGQQKFMCCLYGIECIRRLGPEGLDAMFSEEGVEIGVVEEQAVN